MSKLNENINKELADLSLYLAIFFGISGLMIPFVELIEKIELNIAAYIFVIFSSFFFVSISILLFWHHFTVPKNVRIQRFDMIDRQNKLELKYMRRRGNG